MPNLTNKDIFNKMLIFGAISYLRRLSSVWTYERFVSDLKHTTVIFYCFFFKSNYFPNDFNTLEQHENTSALH